MKLDDLVKIKKAKLKTPADAEGKKKQKSDLDYIQQYYMNPIKLALFLTMSRPYLDRGDIKILTDCENIEIKKDLNQFIFYGRDYSYAVVFESKKLTRIISESSLAEADLIDTLLKNAELFCISSGKNFVVDKNGKTRLVNTFDAVGLSTRYLKNDVEWRSRTIVLSTSRNDLKEKLRNATQSPQSE